VTSLLHLSVAALVVVAAALALTLVGLLGAAPPLETYSLFNGHMNVRERSGV
jgi:hypothetical protein